MSSVRRNNNGTLVNPVLRDCYTDKIEHGKKKKVALAAVMHKLINYIFAVLRDQKPYELRQPDVHKRLHFKI